jgi:putative tryptophan/tyrosine transport system substrate-binding protein
MTATAAAAAGSVLPAFARAARLRIGVLLPVPDANSYVQHLREGLRDFGWTDESGLSLEVRQADGTVAAFRQLGAELATLPVDILVTASTAAALALKMVTTSIPVVFVGTFDPVAAGLVTSLKRSGGNLTGIAGFKDSIGREWVNYLRAIAPSVERVKIFVNPPSIAPAALAGWKAAMFKIIVVEELRVDRADDIERAVGGVSVDSKAGIVVVPHTFPFANRQTVVDAMAKYRVPAIYGIAEMVRSGGLISYGQNLAAQWRAAGRYVVEIAKGASPSNLTVTYADAFDLAINRRSASALGLSVPASLIARANEVLD